MSSFKIQFLLYVSPVTCQTDKTLIIQVKKQHFIYTIIKKMSTHTASHMDTRLAIARVSRVRVRVMVGVRVSRVRVCVSTSYGYAHGYG